MNSTNLSATTTTPAVPQGENTASDWVTEVSGLVSPPDVCIKVFDLIESHNPSAATIGEVITRDPNLSLRLLKIVNSSYYNFSSKIDTISRAIAIIGISELYSMVIAITAVKTFSYIPHNVVNMDTFWRHSLYCGVISRLLAKRLNVLHPERLFVAGLMHDIGSLILYHRAPQTAKELLIQSKGDEDVLHQLEISEFGFSHAAIGGLLMKLWHIPDPICNAVANHHQPAMAKEAVMETAIVHMANALANHTEIGAFCELPMTELAIADEAWSQIGIAPEDMDHEALLEEAGQQFSEMISIFY